MKKLTLTLLFLLGTIFTLSAQHTFKKDIFAFLRNEGYVPSYDEEGDIKFKMEGIGYFVIVHEPSHGEYAYVEVMASFNTDASLDELMRISNRFNQSKYVCKCMAYEKGDGQGFIVSMEFITDSHANTEFQMGTALQLLPGWIEAFAEELKNL